MKADEADQRIALSRATLYGYRQMTEALQWPIDDLPLFEREIVVLESIGMEHPGKIEKVIRLVEGWGALRERIRQQMH